MRPVPPTFTERRPVLASLILLFVLLAVALGIGLGLGSAGSWVITSLLGLLQDG